MLNRIDRTLECYSARRTRRRRVTLWVVAAFENAREVLPSCEVEIREALRPSESAFNSRS
jgi:hypothetical protein